jgi:hypothetical protein
MERMLSPQGTSDLVHITLKPATYVSHSVIKECIEDFKKKVLMSEALGEEPSPLAKIGFMVLKDSSCLEDLSKESEE